MNKKLLVLLVLIILAAVALAIPLSKSVRVSLPVPSAPAASKTADPGIVGNWNPEVQRGKKLYYNGQTCVSYTSADFSGGLTLSEDGTAFSAGLRNSYYTFEDGVLTIMSPQKYGPITFEVAELTENRLVLFAGFNALGPDGQVNIPVCYEFYRKS